MRIFWRLVVMLLGLVLLTLCCWMVAGLGWCCVYARRAVDRVAFWCARVGTKLCDRIDSVNKKIDETLDPPG